MKRGYYAKEVKLAVMLSCRKENWVFLYRLSTTVCVSGSASHVHCYLVFSPMSFYVRVSEPSSGVTPSNQSW